MRKLTKSGLILLFLILCIGAFLRFYRLTTVPPSLSHDEAAIAYNAYSVLKTGKDEYGKPFPLLFRSFDDYKLPGMVYSSVPFVALFGRTEIAARLPSAIYGTLAIAVMAMLVLELTGSPVTALFGALLLALQPWHVNFSRQLFESNGAVFWFMLGTYFLLRSRNRYGEILWAGLSYVIALYFYYSVRLVIPFVLLTYLFLQRKTFMKEWKTTLLSLLVCAAVFFPMGREMLSPGGWERINTVSVVNDKNFIARREAYTNIIARHPTMLNKIIYNRRVALLETAAENYWKNIAPHNLFETGTGTYGALYPFDMLLVPLGLILLFGNPSFGAWILIVWLITAFFPGAFSTNQPNTLRTLIAAPPFAALSAISLSYLFSKRKYAFALFVLLFVLAFPKFLSAYFMDNPTHNAVSFADGNKQMVRYVTGHQSLYSRIYVSGYYWRPYVFFLYWGNTDPSYYQESGNRDHFGKYYFTSASWDSSGIKLMDASFDLASLPHDGRTLFILSPQEYTKYASLLTKLDDINGRVAPKVFVAAILTK